MFSIPRSVEVCGRLAISPAPSYGAEEFSPRGRAINLRQKKRKAEETCCVYNQTRESFLCLNVKVTDTHASRLKGLVGKRHLKPDEGIWVIPSQGVHTIGVLFSVDLIYLDAQDRVIHLEESFGKFRIGPVRKKCASVLELPTRTIYSSQTQVGDQLLIRSLEAMEEFLRGSDQPRLKIVSTGGGGET